jgi:hypothetical protein
MVMRTRPCAGLALALGLTCFGGPALAQTPQNDPRLLGAARGERQGWITLRLEGAPSRIGFQHGFLLSREIEDALAVTKLSLTHDGKRSWAFFRDASKTVLWPRIEEEYREELEGIAAGLAARGVRADVWDVVALNANIEFGYYTAWLDARKNSAAPDRCSAFVATGRYTRDGRPVIGHNNWSGYLEGSRWNLIVEIRPERGHRIFMDGFPGLIHSGDDFGVNAAGIAITETTITGFKGFDPAGIPEFVRARKAMQYASSIDDFDRIMREGNNGGYANAWLAADVNSGEIARLELGLRWVTLERTRDGYFTGANFPIHPKLTAEETNFAANDPGVSANARRTRWEQLMKEHEGKIDVAAGKRFLADHFDAFEGKADAPSERTLCGHIDLSPRGLKPWADEFGSNGTVQAKVADTAMIRRLAFEAAMGHPCGIHFRAADHLKRNPGQAWQKDLLRDLLAYPWTLFEASRDR